MPTATSTRVVSSIPNAPLGATVTFTATVVGAAAAPTGNVQFKNKGVVIGTTALSAIIPETALLNDAQAVFATSALSAISNVITATYVGDVDNDPSTSSALLQTIVPTAAGMARRLGILFQHDQPSASDTWVIVHNLNDYPIVDVYVDFNGGVEKIIPNEVTYTDANTCTVTFTTPFSGFATVV